MNCRYGAVLYRCSKCGQIMCSKRQCPKGSPTRTNGGSCTKCGGATKPA